MNRAIKDTYVDTKLNSDDIFIEFIKEKIIDLVYNKENDGTIAWNFLYELWKYLNNDSLNRIADFFSTKLYWWNKLDFFFKNWDENIYPNDTRFLTNIEREFNSLSSITINNLSGIKKIGLKIIIKYYDEMIRGFSNKEHLSPLIKRLEKRILDLEKVIRIKDENEIFNSNFTVISLRDVNLDIRKMIPMLLVKELYDEKRKENDETKSLHIIIDEAHNILSRNSDRESEQWKDYRLEVFEEIIKEWRKFWTFLTIASQRPSDISSTIISQLHNYFLHRLINNNDLLAVEKTIAYLDKVSADSIPNLATWTCILAWLIAQIPVVMKVWEIKDKENRPNSDTITLIDKWKD